MERFKEGTLETANFDFYFSELRYFVNSKKTNYIQLIKLLHGCFKDNPIKFKDILVPYLFNMKKLESLFKYKIFKLDDFEKDEIRRLVFILKELKTVINFEKLFFDFELKITHLCEDTIDLIQVIGAENVNLIIVNFNSFQIIYMSEHLDLSKLKSLYIDSSNILIDYGPISQYITGFNFRHPVSKVALERLKKHKYQNLKFLKFATKSGVNIDDFYDLNGPELEVIDLDIETTVSSFTQMDTGKGNTYLSKVYIDSVKDLNKFKKLKVLNFDYKSSSNLDLSELDLPGLKEIVIAGCVYNFYEFLNNYQYQLKSLICLQDFGNNYELDDDKIVAIAKKCINFDHLYLYGGYVTEEGLKEALRYVNVRELAIYDSDIEGISSETIEAITKARVEVLMLYGNFVPQKTVDKIHTQKFGTCSIEVDNQYD